MKKLLLPLLFLSSPALAKGAVGLGLSSLSSGVSGYTDLDGEHCLQGLFGITRPIALVADYCWKKPLKGNVNWYIGAGGYVSNVGVGVRMPVGILYGNDVVQVSGELAPTFNDNAHLTVDITLAVRAVL
jgi:hypothetical protein